MLRLALETSHREASVALRVGDVTLEQRLDPTRSHASDCLALFARLIEEQGLAPADIERIYVGTGPGSYTGLRIGIATALGLARGAGAEVRGEPSGEALVWRALDAGQEGVFLLDARQDQLYFAHYKRTRDDVEVLVPASVMSPQEVRECMPSRARIFGDENALEIAGLGDLVAERFVRGSIPEAGALLELAERRFEALGPQALDTVEPLYLRPFQAKTRRR